MTVCLTEVRDAAKELLNEDDAKVLINELQNRARAKAESQAVSYEQALRDAAEDMSNEQARDVALAKYKQHLNIVKRIDRNSYYEGFGNDAKALRAITVGVVSGKGAKRSTALLQKKITNQLLGGFGRDLKAEGVMPIFNSKEYERELAKDLFEPGSSQNPEVRKVSEIFKKWSNISRKMLNKEGADVGELQEYMGRNSHNPDMLRRTSDGWVESFKDRRNYAAERKASGAPYDKNYLVNKAYERWRDYILPRLDSTRTFQGADVEKFLRSSYDNLVSGVHNSQVEAAERYQAVYAFKGPGNLAKRISQNRKLHFKDGVSFYEYNQKFGYGSMHSNLLRTFESAGNNLGLLRIWGTNPEAAFHRDLRDMQEKTENKRDIKMNRQLNNNKMQQFFDIVSGASNVPANAKLARNAANLRAWKSIGSLGFSTPRSIPDLAKRASQMHASTGQSFMSSLLQTLGDIMQGRPQGEMEHIADLTNVWAKGVHEAVMEKFSTGDAPGGFTSKAMQKFFKLNLMRWWDEALIKGTGISVSRDLGMMRRREFPNLHENSKYTLNLYGIEEKEWELIRTAKPTLAKNQEFVTADAMANLSDRAIAKYLGKDVSELKRYQIDNVKRDMNDRVGMYITDQAAQVIPDNPANVKRLMLQGTRPGTPMGELARFVGQFKSFTADFTMNVLSRDVARTYNRVREAEGFKNKMIAGAGDVWGIAQYIGWGAALWYVGNSATDIAKGKTPRALNEARTWAAALVGGGGLGIYGDFLFGEYTSNRFGGGLLETAAGPVLGEAAQLARLIGKIESGDDPSNAAFQFVKNNAPFLNLFYTRIGLDYLILYGLQERFAPGSLRRMENRLRNEQEQEFLLPPSQYAAGQ